MNKKLFRKLAVQNIKANRTTFLPFILCTITMVGMFYMLNAISYQVNINRFSGSTTMRTILEFGKSVCGIFSFFVILYTNSFVMKRRAKELGLYSMLGMNKRHIGKVVFWELGISGGISIVSGLGLGMLFSKFMFLLLEAMLDLNTGIKFTIVAEPIFSTLALFVGIFALGIIFNFIRVLRLKPIELMRSTRTGEVEPKTKWIMAIAGVVCLGIGYYMAVTIENPVTAISLFFVAALLVIAGTYFTFVSVSIVILKALKKNKKFFYNKKHFITVSGLIYRMKQNAVGLANICVLSTAVLVIMFSTVALYIGSEDAIASQYPIDTDIGFYWHEEDFDKGASIFDEKVIGEIVSNRAKKYNVQVKDVQYGFSYISTGVAKGNEFESVSFFNDNIAMTDLITVDNYNRITGENITLEDDEVLMSTKLDDFDAEKEMIYNGKKYKVKG